MASEESTVYCICRKPYDENEFMIECEICKDWFHGRYVEYYIFVIMVMI